MKAKKLLSLLAVMLTTFILCGCGGEKKAEAPAPAKAAPVQKAQLSGKKPLIVYFTWSTAKYTENVAKEIQKFTGADMFRVETVKPYPTVYKECTEYAKAELQRGELPAIKGGVANIADYDLIFIGYPVWWYEAPMAIYSFLDKHNLAGKKIAVFATSGGTTIEKTLPKLKATLKNSTVLDPGLLANGSGEVEPWLKKLGIL